MVALHALWSHEEKFADSEESHDLAQKFEPTPHSRLVSADSNGLRTFESTTTDLGLPPIHT